MGRPETTDDPRRTLRRLYRGLDGFLVPEHEEDRVVRAKSSPLYGEIMPAAVGHLLDYLRLGSRDVLYDLGSGVGKMVVQAALSVRTKKLVGIELVRARHEVAEAVLEEARRARLLRTKNVSFACRDFMRTDLSDATVVYTCSTAFSTPYLTRLARRLTRLKKGALLVSLQDLDEQRAFELVDVLRLDMSWKRRSKVYVYRLERPRASR